MSASSIPQPTAAPFTAAMIGTSVRSRLPAAGVRLGSRSARCRSALAADHHLFDVIARAERRISPGDHETPGGGGVDGVRELGVRRERQRIARLGTIDRDDADVAALLVLDLGVHAASPPFGVDAARGGALVTVQILDRRSPGSHLVLTEDREAGSRGKPRRTSLHEPAVRHPRRAPHGVGASRRLSARHRVTDTVTVSAATRARSFRCGGPRRHGADRGSGRRLRDRPAG